MTMDFDYLYVTSTKLKKVNDKNVKHVSHLILKVSFLTLNTRYILTLYMVKWIGLILMTSKTCDNHRQRDKQINKLKREDISLRTKLVIFFNWGKINAIAPE